MTSLSVLDHRANVQPIFLNILFYSFISFIHSFILPFHLTHLSQYFGEKGRGISVFFGGEQPWVVAYQYFSTHSVIKNFSLC